MRDTNHGPPNTGPLSMNVTSDLLAVGADSGPPNLGTDSVSAASITTSAT